MSLSFDFAYLPAGPVHEAGMLASLGEAVGFRGMWIPDQGFFRDPFVLCGVAAGATSQLRIGVGITTPLTRHPVQIARAAGALDELMPGRFRLGLGTGNIPNVIRPLGVPFDRPLARLRKGLLEVAQLLDGQRVAFANINGATDVGLDFEVPRRIPLYIGARGPKTIAMAAELADGILAESLFAGDGPAFVSDSVLAGTKTASRDSAEVDVVSWQVLYVTDNPAAVIDRFRPWLVRIIGVGPKEMMLRVGVPEEIFDEIADAIAVQDLDRAARAISADVANRLVMVGPPEELVDRIGELHDRGFSTVSMLSVDDAAETAANLARFGHDVMPRLLSRT